MKYPIVFVPGSSLTKNWVSYDYFFEIDRWLKSLGYETSTVSFPCFRTIDERSMILEEHLKLKHSGQKVHLIAHSAGGLDSRVMLSRLSPHIEVASLSTIMTPHQGTKLIDFWTDYAPKFILRLIERYCSRHGGSLEYWLEYSPRKTLPLMNRLTENPTVKKFSVVSSIPKHPLRSLILFWIPYWLVKRAEGPTDGFVSVQSATWGEVISHENADHFQLVGHPFGFTRGYDYFSIYRKIIHRLIRLEDNLSLI